jgi:hypothetical protein
MDTLGSRQTAISWFNSHNHDQKEILFNKYSHLILMGHDRNYSDLTGREIEEIWCEETQSTISDEQMKMLSDAAREEMDDDNGLALTKEQQVKQVRHYFAKFTDLANQCFHEGDTEIQQYWKGQVMGMCKIVQFTDMDIDINYYLKRLI